MMKKQRGLIFWSIMALLCLIPKESFAQNINVQGKVIDETGEAMFNVTIQIKGTQQGTFTNLDGVFNLPNVPPNATLVFNYVGYTTQEVAVTGGRMDVRMVPDALSLEEVVVIAFGTQKKVTVTGAIASVGSEEILKSPAASVTSALAGRLAGLQSMQNTGTPGNDAATLYVRGISSQNSGSALVLVDGIERSFTQIDPNEIADITILKDASATAVFGVRGGAGVILVTTKRGEMGKATVSVSSSAGLNHATQYIKFTNSYDYATAYNYAQERDGVPAGQWRFSQEAIQHYKDRDNLWVYPDTDWIKLLMNDNAWQDQHNINVRGGTELLQYFVSVGVLTQRGLFKTREYVDPNENFGYSRYNYRANLDINVTKNSTLSFNIGGMVGNRTHMGGDESELFDYFEEAVPYAGLGIDDQGRRIIADPALNAYYRDGAIAHIYRLGYVRISNNQTNLDFTYKLNLDAITKGLSFDLKGAYNSSFSQTKNRKNGFGSGAKYMATFVEGVVDEKGNPQTVLVRDGVTPVLPYSESRSGSRNWDLQAALRYNRRFGQHNVQGLAMYTQRKTYYPGGTYPDINLGRISFVGRATYDFASKYVVEFNLGITATENFARENRYGAFPALSVGWVPSAENFWEPIRPVISFLKFRGSYGLRGNDGGSSRFEYLPGSYTFMNGTSNNNGTNNANSRGANFGTNSNYWNPGARENTLGNPNITWETHYNRDIGIDIKFLKDRLSISADYFSNLATNIITSNSATLPSILSIPSSNINYNETENKGFDFEMSWRDRIKDFSYSIRTVAGFARNKRVKTLEVPQLFDYQYSNGHSTYTPYMYEFFGFYQEGVTEELYKKKYGVDKFPDPVVTLKDGDIVYVDLNGDSKIDAQDQHYVGFGNYPELNGSINVDLNYKGFGFSMLWLGVTNTTRELAWNYYRQPFGSTADYILTQWVHDNYWTYENADKAIFPRISFTQLSYNCNRASSVWRVDASYVRLKNLEINYTIRRIPILPTLRNLTLYATGSNLLTFTSLLGNDPEASTVGYPLVRIFNFGFRVTL